MKKSMGAVIFCAALAVSVFAFSLLSDSRALKQELVRLHVVAASDEEADQAIKLKVRDAVLSSIREGMEQAGNAQEARAYLEENLPKIQRTADRCLKSLGCTDPVSVTLMLEKFPKRLYDTFALPAGIYESLRVTIGEGQGHNWWCVAFPQLCMPAASGDMEAVAAQAGLSESLRGAMTGRYEIRFFLLDLLGRLK